MSYAAFSIIHIQLDSRFLLLERITGVQPPPPGWLFFNEKGSFFAMMGSSATPNWTGKLQTWAPPPNICQIALYEGPAI